MIDLGAELLAAIRSPDGRAAIADAVRPVGAAEVRAALAEAGDALLDARAAAEHVALTPLAFRARARRDPTLHALALGAGRLRRWRRSDLDRWLADRARQRGDALPLDMRGARDGVTRPGAVDARA